MPKVPRHGPFLLKKLFSLNLFSFRAYQSLELLRIKLRRIVHGHIMVKIVVTLQRSIRAKFSFQYRHRLIIPNANIFPRSWRQFLVGIFETASFVSITSIRVRVWNLILCDSGGSNQKLAQLVFNSTAAFETLNYNYDVRRRTDHITMLWA